MTDILLQHFLMYLVVPVWLLAGLADYFCHRASHIECTSGVAESLLHLLQFAFVGVPLLAALFLEINAAVLLTMLAGLVLHQATAMWDVSYAAAMREVIRVTLREQSLITQPRSHYQRRAWPSTTTAESHCKTNSNSMPQSKTSPKR